MEKLNGQMANDLLVLTLMIGSMGKGRFFGRMGRNWKGIGKMGSRMEQELYIIQMEVKWRVFG